MVRVVCTGIGITTSIGAGKDGFWQGVLQHKCGAQPLIRINENNFSKKYAYEISEDFVKEKELGRASALALYTVGEAITDARLISLDNVPLIIGTGLCDFKAYEDSVLTNEYFNCESIATNLNRYLNNTGFSLTISTGCAAGNYAIGYAYDLIKSGQVEVAVAGGSECLANVMFGILDRVNPAEPTCCQPFNAQRKGVLLGEGSAFLILESIDSAKIRKTKIYGEVFGYGLSCDAGHPTAPDKMGLVEAMNKALNDSGCKPEEIDYIAMHGTGTVLNDITETAAVKDVFGSHSYKLATSSIKGMVGHTGGASGAVSTAATFLAMEKEIIPPTIGLTQPDPLCDLDYTPNKCRGHVVNKALINAFGFGGNNCCIVVGRYRG